MDRAVKVRLAVAYMLLGVTPLPNESLDTYVERASRALPRLLAEGKGRMAGEASAAEGGGGGGGGG